jgi:O-antigen/teichoic acid export membrane protein
VSRIPRQVARSGSAVGNAWRRLAVGNAWRRLRADSLYRNSAALMLNTAVGAGFGALFLVTATKHFATDQVGLLTTSVSASVLLGTMATLGLPNALIRFLPARPESAATICATALALCGAGGLAVFALARTSPFGMPISRPGRAGTLVALAIAIVLVLVTNMVVDAAFIAQRTAHVLVVKNAVGGLVKVGCLLALEPGGVVDLAVAHLAGTAVSALVALAWLARSLHGSWLPRWSSLRGAWAFSLPNHAAMIAGSLPMTATPLIVLDLLGAGQAAYYGVDLMLLSAVNVVPQTVSVSLFAELSNEPDAGRSGLRRAVLGLYALLVPGVVLMLVCVPPVLHLFGDDYLRDGAGALRWLVAGTLVGALNYVVDSVVNSRGDATGYLFLNVTNAAFVLGGVALGARADLAHAGIGWVAAQGLSAALGLAYLRLTEPRARRPRSSPSTLPAPAEHP